MSLRHRRRSHRLYLRVVFDALRKSDRGVKMIEVRRISGTQLDGVSLYVVFTTAPAKRFTPARKKKAEEK